MVIDVLGSRHIQIVLINMSASDEYILHYDVHTGNAVSRQRVSKDALFYFQFC